MKTAILIGALALAGCEAPQATEYYEIPMIVESQASGPCAKGIALSQDYEGLLKRIEPFLEGDQAVEAGFLYIETNQAKSNLDKRLEIVCGIKADPANHAEM